MVLGVGGEENVTSFSRKLSSADLLKADSNEKQTIRSEKEREREQLLIEEQISQPEAEYATKREEEE